MATCRFDQCRKVLLIEADNQKQWAGSFVQPEVHIPPVGLLSLAATLLKQYPGMKVRVLVTSLEAPSRESFFRKLDEFKPDAIGIRGINMFFDEVRQISGWAKEWRQDIPVVVGGPLATSMKGALLEGVGAIDIAVKDEGESTFSELFAGTKVELVSGIISRDGAGAIVESRDRGPILHLDELPFPDYGLVDLDAYERHLSYAYNHRRQGVLSTSRGCPFQCTYCFTFGGKNVRLRTADNVFREMEFLEKNQRVRDFYFVDDIFNIDKQRVWDICRKINDAKKDWRLYFVNGLRADILDTETVDRLIGAGTVWITYAIETGDPVLQELTKRRMNLEKAREIINYTQDRGIAVNINTMYGFPTETPEMAQTTLDWLGGLRRPSLLPYHFCLRGYEGCEIVDEGERTGWDRSVFLADNNLAYHDLPNGTPTFSRKDMRDHVVQYHERFGLGNPSHMKACVDTLHNIGYTRQDVLDMYTVLLNRPVASVEQIYRGAGSRLGDSI